MYNNFNEYTSLQLHKERAQDFEQRASESRLVKESEEERRQEWIAMRRRRR